MRGRAFVITLVSVGACASACTSLGGLSGGDTSAIPDAASDVADEVADNADAATFADSCTSYASVYCDRFSGCYPALIELQFGGPSACQTRLRESCLAEVSAPGVRATAADLDRCTAAISIRTCDAMLTSTGPTECTAPGARPNGASCVSDLQCQSAFCGDVTSNGCGRCAPAAKEGSPCGAGCAPPLTCTLGTCVTPGVVGASCDDAHPCQTALACANGSCAAQLEKGDTCGPTTPPCSEAKGFFCVGGTCTPIAFAAADQPCGSVNGRVTFCSGGLCQGPDGGAQGTCVAFAQPGESCNLGSDPPKPCLIVNACVAGECVYPTQSLCPP